MVRADSLPTFTADRQRRTMISFMLPVLYIPAPPTISSALLTLNAHHDSIDVFHILWKLRIEESLSVGRDPSVYPLEQVEVGSSD